MVGAFASAMISCCLLPAEAGLDKIAASVDRAFRPLMQEYDVPGIAVAVTTHGQEYFFNYGLASKEGHVPVTKDTLFEIGSISKTFTATLGCYAFLLGKVSLDDHPGKFMPPLRGSAIDKASLLNLATYTAGGLPLQVPDDVTNDTEMAAYFQKWRPDAAPGTQRRYSNPSIGLFGYLISLAMDGNFTDLIEAQIFPKLGLGNSYIRVPQAQTRNYAWGYDKAGAPIRVRPGVLDAETYGVKTSTSDMLRFVEANIHPEKLEDPIRRAIEGTHVGYFRIGGMVQGLGWEQNPYPITLHQLLAANSTKISLEANDTTPITQPRAPEGHTLFNKTGSTNGFGAYVAFVPDKEIGIVMLANKNFPIAARIEAARAVLEELSSDMP
jgi:beta-lactamase class C